MKFSRIDLAEEIARRLKAGKPSKAIAKKAAAYLMENGKTSEVNSLERDIIEARIKSDKVVELNAISAHGLDSAQLESIKKSVKKFYPDCKEVIINQVQDQSIIGGIRLEFANKLLDLSASSKLNKLRHLISQ